jgi:hypothetical protein
MREIFTSQNSTSELANMIARRLRGTANNRQGVYHVLANERVVASVYKQRGGLNPPTRVHVLDKSYQERIAQAIARPTSRPY